MLDLNQPLQNGTEWMIELCGFDGVRIAPPLDSAMFFWTTNTVNNVGGFQLGLPDTFPKYLLQQDYRVKFWRKPVSGRMYKEFEGLIRAWENSADEFGAITRVIGGPGLNFTLSGRVIAYRDTTAQANKTDNYDDLIKAFVRENLGASAGTGRILSALTVQEDIAAAPTATRAVSFRNALAVLQELADASRQAGTELYFDIVPYGDNNFIFQTFTGQRGVDRSGVNGLTFSLENGNLKFPKYIRDSMSAATTVYGLGKNEALLRDVQTAQDNTRANYSPFSRREVALNASSDEPSAVLAKANALVNASRPVQKFTGELLSVPGYIYGKDWWFGDKANAFFDDENYTIMARSVNCSVSADGVETVKCMAEVYA